MLSFARLGLRRAGRAERSQQTGGNGVWQACEICAVQERAEETNRSAPNNARVKWGMRRKRARQAGEQMPEYARGNCREVPGMRGSNGSKCRGISVLPSFFRAGAGILCNSDNFHRRARKELTFAKHSARMDAETERGSLR